MEQEEEDKSYIPIAVSGNSGISFLSLKKLNHLPCLTVLEMCLKHSAEM